MNAPHRLTEWERVLRHPRAIPAASLMAAAKHAQRLESGRAVYLATPYTRLARAGQAQQAANVAADCVGWMARKGVTAVSPIVLAHAACEQDPQLDPLAEKFWTDWCAPLLWACGAVVVPDIPGREASKGVAYEAAWALRNSRTLIIVSPEGAR